MKCAKPQGLRLRTVSEQTAQCCAELQTCMADSLVTPHELAIRLLTGFATLSTGLGTLSWHGSVFSWQGLEHAVYVASEQVVSNKCAAVDLASSCRYGVCNWEYEWDETESSDDEYGDESSTPRDMTVSPRSARLRQQQDAHSRRGPKVLQPEGAALLQQCSSWVHQIQGRSGSPSRPSAEEYQQPVETDDLATVVRIFVQHEVLKHARRSRLAGSTLGIRKAKGKPLNMQSWNTLPVGSCLT